MTELKLQWIHSVHMKCVGGVDFTNGFSKPSTMYI